MLESKRHLLLLTLYCCVSLCIAIDTTTIQSFENETSTSSSAIEILTTLADLITEISVTELQNASVSTLVNNRTDLPLLTTSTASGDATFSSPMTTVSTTSTRGDSTPGTISLNKLISTTAQPKKNISDVLQKWLHLENVTKIFAKKSIKGLLPGLMEGTNQMNISASCRRDVLKLLIGLQNIKTWAFSFIDASGKIIDGMLGGTLASIGEYDQCLAIKATNDRRGKNFGQVMFTGQYCALDLKPPLPPKPRYYKLNDVVPELKEFAAGDNIINEAAKAAQFFHFISMRLGICVPSGCQPSDIQQVVDRVVKETTWEAKVKRCELKQENEYTPTIIGVMTAMCSFGFLVSVGSLIDLYHRYAQKKITNQFLEILMCFSFLHNFKKLISTKNSNESMGCLHGLRFLSISWVVLGHTYLNINYTLFRGLRNAMEFQRDFFFQAVVNASVAVDTFFFLGGFLVCYMTVKLVVHDRKPFNVFLYILHRLFRLLPVYIMIIAVIFLAPILGSGPTYHDSVDPFIDACYKNWWTNVLFVNNFVNSNEICLPQSWYVSCDMQLYLVALLVIVPMIRWPWVGLSVASLGILASVGGTIAMTYIYEYPPTMLFVHPDIEQRVSYWANAYFKPYSHAGPYCIGLIIGYVLATHPKLKFSMTTRIIGWLIAIASNMAVLYGVYEWNSGRDAEIVETLVYSGLHRVAWTFGIAWIVLTCATGQGGVVNYILSWKIWIPLGRLTYGIYLIHPIVQIAAIGNIRMRLQTTHYFAVWIYFGHMMITIGSAFAASILVEAPFIGLEKIMLRAITGKPVSSTNGHATMPNGSTAPKQVNSEEQRNEPVSHL